ncbi:hypothetical protein [Isoptericola sp. NPDC057391]|uniref:hypothetical protein n=1 Tax=Isoptericola sp. NPDC057391 TaxID=3346117 RepID=UPI0036403167
MREAEHLPAIRRITEILGAMTAPGSRLRRMLSADAAHPPLVPHTLELASADDVVMPPSHEEAILALVREVADGTEAPLWFSHETAAMVHGAWTYRTPQLVHVTREWNPHVDGEGEPLVRRHHTPMPPQDRADVRGVPVTSLARTLVDCIRTLPRDGALVACDSLFRRGADPAEVSRIMSSSRGKRGVVQAREILDLCDPRSGSPGETVTRLAAADVGLPRPECQLEVATARGTCFVDLGFADVRLAVEFDGELKYDDDAERVLREERARQDALEDAGWMVIRVRWEELEDLAALEHRLRRAYLAARRRVLLGLTA